jgi:hypothetical protein
VIRKHRDELWLFQETGLVDVWTTDLKDHRTVSLGHPESIREDFPSGCVVCLDMMDEETAVALTSDGVVGIYALPDWTPLCERPFEMAPSWIDVTPGGELAVGFFSDEIEIFAIVK